MTNLMYKTKTSSLVAGTFATLTLLMSGELIVIYYVSPLMAFSIVFPAFLSLFIPSVIMVVLLCKAIENSQKNKKEQELQQKLGDKEKELTSQVRQLCDGNNLLEGRVIQKEQILEYMIAELTEKNNILKEKYAQKGQQWEKVRRVSKGRIDKLTEENNFLEEKCTQTEQQLEEVIQGLGAKMAELTKENDFFKEKHAKTEQQLKEVMQVLGDAIAGLAKKSDFLEEECAQVKRQLKGILQILEGIYLTKKNCNSDLEHTAVHRGNKLREKNKVLGAQLDKAKQKIELLQSVNYKSKSEMVCEVNGFAVELNSKWKEVERLEKKVMRLTEEKEQLVKEKEQQYDEFEKINEKNERSERKLKDLLNEKSLEVQKCQKELLNVKEEKKRFIQEAIECVVNELIKWIRHEVKGSDEEMSEVTQKIELHLKEKALQYFEVNSHEENNLQNSFMTNMEAFALFQVRSGTSAQGVASALSRRGSV
ncbi:MAG: hypothetical protein QWI36_01535 [Wolbachia endosymbiont of Tyrophagus putrescentiae]|nr:hypothetical protein [Wolbachia endosymbiont of Tyrophagus putrescentiae]